MTVGIVSKTGIYFTSNSSNQNSEKRISSAESLKSILKKDNESNGGIEKKVRFSEVNQIKIIPARQKEESAEDLLELCFQIAIIGISAIGAVYYASQQI